MRTRHPLFSTRGVGLRREVEPPEPRHNAAGAAWASFQEIHEKGCEKCNSNDGSDSKDDAGILAGQWLPYLKATLTEFSSNKRPWRRR